MSTPKPQIGKIKLAHIALSANRSIKDICTNCGRIIQTMAFIGTGVCCEDCRKDRDGDHDPARALNP